MWIDNKYTHERSKKFANEKCNDIVESDKTDAEKIADLKKAFPEAVKRYRKAAEQGDADAQAVLGAYYFLGYGVTQNFAEAVKWWKKAAEQGLKDAQYNLGICYYNGYGVAKDITEAVKWLRKAAKQGDADAQKRLRELGETW